MVFIFLRLFSFIWGGRSDYTPPMRKHKPHTIVVIKLISNADIVTMQHDDKYYASLLRCFCIIHLSVSHSPRWQHTCCYFRLVLCKLVVSTRSNRPVRVKISVILVPYLFHWYRLYDIRGLFKWFCNEDMNEWKKK